MAANKLWLNEKINKQLILQTFLGSLKLLKNHNKSANELAISIAIKGGTTEAGIKVMKKNKVAALFKKGKEAIRKNEKSNTRSA